MIRVVIVDDHPALRAGLRTVLESEPGIVYAGESSGSEESLWPILHTRRSQTSCYSTTTCRTATGCSSATGSSPSLPAPAVIIFSAYASGELTFPAHAREG